MKTPKTSQLRNTAVSYNRKKWRREMIAGIKTLNKRFKQAARRGHTRDSLTVSEEKSGYQALIIMRWYRRYSGLNVTIHENADTVNGKRYIDTIRMTVNWE